MGSVVFSHENFVYQVPGLESSSLHSSPLTSSQRRLRLLQTQENCFICETNKEWAASKDHQTSTSKYRAYIGAQNKGSRGAEETPGYVSGGETSRSIKERAAEHWQAFRSRKEESQHPIWHLRNINFFQFERLWLFFKSVDKGFPPPFIIPQIS